jgi:hypothetical protein
MNRLADRVRNVPKTRRYVSSKDGHTTITAILAARHADSATPTGVP